MKDWRSRYWTKVDVRGEDECWPWLAQLTGTDKRGKFWLDGKLRSSTHIALILDGRPQPPAPGNLALHSCDHPSCHNPKHLRWGSNADNTADMAERQRFRPMRGSHHPRSKLTESDVRHIRSSPLGVKKLGKQLGVASSLVHRVRQGKVWRHVQ